ncbi:YciI family protein [Cellulomonas rhizosphaerae]|uniref:YCII-related domain-containing protein n=1 Tax=Cellulomonas rhizosphaerae TaxID=2293719 RepID=A0A413RQ57_9CELL|nr:YciI family protein [Cellulomonas rhizosphaerae]RHA44083.1 hypothetical protein D1825_03050 [Cellulomonas rhizosphaerae]
MPSFIFIYRAGPDPVPADRVAENRAAWHTWNAELQEEHGIRTAGGASVSARQIDDYRGDVRGASLVEFDSLEAAVAVARASPNIAFGGTVDVLEEYQRP